jgi:hypothetical protein
MIRNPLAINTGIFRWRITNEARQTVRQAALIIDEPKSGKTISTNSFPVDETTHASH